jgi:Zn-dependent peptidase ImmA (M78 family)
MSVRRFARRNPEGRAAEILAQHHQSRALPIPVDEIARALGAEIRHVKFEDQDLSGMLVRERDQRIISVQKRHGVARKRFTIAHELGHLLMHPGRPIIAETDKLMHIDLRTKTPGYANPQEEREANQFAAALLMPAELVQNHWNSLSLTQDDPAEIADLMAREFGVSPIAMKYRIANLAIYPDLEALLGP